MGLENLVIVLTKHAHEQYCERVEQIGRTELLELLGEQMVSADRYRKQQYLQLDGCWWVYEIHDGCLFLITCYGRTSFDLPAVIKWQQLHNDRVNLFTGGEVVCDGEG